MNPMLRTNGACNLATVAQTTVANTTVAETQLAKTLAWIL